MSIISKSLQEARPASVPGSRFVRKHLDATRYEEFWFHDCPIVLLVGSLMFRVRHQTVLSTHSEVFAGLPQPPPNTKGQEMVDGAMSSSSTTIPRISTKYMIVSLRHRCIAVLKAKFPSTFTDYTAMISSPHRKHYKSDAVMRAVLLAQECNVLEILPYGFYCVARIGLSRIVTETASDISWKKKAICLVGRERLRWAEMSLSHSFLFAFRSAPSCQTPRCAIAHGPQKEWRVLAAAHAPNPLKLFVRWQALNVCGECIAYAQTQHQAGREEVWQHLPVIFELAAWDEHYEESSTASPDWPVLHGRREIPPPGRIASYSKAKWGV
ncbi:hypothetical protein B0H11DRAFT_2198235 [Mycena galericulata]|nr:hypothetical protein B0H11DRAFT_2198235 [Mycena galericulata]